nr:RecName: Full=Unknown protein 3 [Zinnia elegans]
VSGVADER